MDDVTKRTTTYMLLGHLFNESLSPQKPEREELRLTNDGWEMWGGRFDEPIPVHVDMAYEASGFDQVVLDKTRLLCGDLRMKAKKDRKTRELVDELRAGLERARAIKRQREAA